jgi:hypothetical protein
MPGARYAMTASQHHRRIARSPTNSMVSHEPLELGPTDAYGIYHTDVFDLVSAAETSNGISAHTQDSCDFAGPEERLGDVAAGSFRVQQGYCKKSLLTCIRLHRAGGRLGLECRFYGGLHRLAFVSQ